MNTKELANNNPDAFDSLPPCYKDDAPLEFYVDGNGNTCASAPNGSEYVFKEGRWLSKLNILGL